METIQIIIKPLDKGAEDTHQGGRITPGIFPGLRAVAKVIIEAADNASKAAK